MPIDVEIDGTVHEFPDDFTDADIAAALESMAPQKPAAPQPDTRNSGIGSERVRGWMNQMQDTSADLRADTAAHPYRTAAIIAAPAVLSKAPGIIAKAIGRSAPRATANIQAATQAAKGAPVNVEKVGQEGLRAVELQAAGGSMPRAASRFMQRITDPKAPELTFEEARDFYSNLSRLSTNEFGKLNPTMQRQIGAMREALHQALAESAETVGKGAQYASGISEYAKAAQMKAAWEAAKPKLLGALKTTAKFGLGGYGASKLLNER